MISGAQLGALDSSHFKHGTPPLGFRHADGCQAAAKHDCRGVREDFYRGAGGRRPACLEPVTQVASNLENVEAGFHPAMQIPSEFGCRCGKDVHTEGLKLPLDWS